MDVIPTRPARDPGPPRGHPPTDRGPQPSARCGDARPPARQELPGGLCVERRRSGTSVSGPSFRVWDADHGTALRWARQLARGRQASGPTPHVLLAEDDADLRELLSQALRWRGYRVTECLDGPDLVCRLGSYILFGPPAGFDLVVSDIRMPGATALEILEAMRECEGVPPVILITAFPGEDTRAAARRLGVAAILDKPFETEALLDMAADLLDRRGGGGP
jgi:CheY-like chemotaxis protein